MHTHLLEIAFNIFAAALLIWAVAHVLGAL